MEYWPHANGTAQPKSSRLGTGRMVSDTVQASVNTIGNDSPELWPFVDTHSDLRVWDR